MKKRKDFDLFVLLKYCVLVILYLSFLSLEKETSVYAVSVYASLITVCFNPVSSGIILLAICAVFNNFNLLLSLLFPTVFLTVIYFIYKHFNKTVKYEILLYLALSLTGYVLINKTNAETDYFYNCISALICLLLTAVTKNSFNAIINKSFNQKFNLTENVCLSLTVTVFGLGICNLLSPEVWTLIYSFCILSICFICKKGVGIYYSIVLSLCYFIYYENVNFISYYLLLTFVVETLVNINAYIACLSLILSDYLLQLTFNVYHNYLSHIIFLCVGILLFLIIPKKYYGKLKDKIEMFNDKQLYRESINRNRIMTSNKLFELSGVFKEISGAFYEISKSVNDTLYIKNVLAENTVKNVCEKCENRKVCKEYFEPSIKSLNSLITVGFAKGKISIIDMPFELNKVCNKPNNIINYVNTYINAYIQKQKNENLILSGRNLIAEESMGVAKILSDLALESGSVLKYQSKTEKDLQNAFNNNGVAVTELLIFGEGENLTVSIVVLGKEINENLILSTIKTTLKINFEIVEKAEITLNKTYFSFKKRPSFNAVFGISSNKKDGSIISGDTHSIVRLNKNKLLIAISDGMGSGIKAQNISNVTLSLIESFYKAGLESDLVLKTVNKLLTVNQEENFTALDIGVIDLNTCESDFIKYGSPYGFIINKEGIKIIEGHSLPLGIIDNIKPQICKTVLQKDDTVLFMSDGIADAFNSSDKLINILRSISFYNPQNLADTIMKKALETDNGIKKDDMTVLAVRLFENV